MQILELMHKDTPDPSKSTFFKSGDQMEQKLMLKFQNKLFKRECLWQMMSIIRGKDNRKSTHISFEQMLFACPSNTETDACS
jgi:hypothetical protein